MTLGLITSKKIKVRRIYIEEDLPFGVSLKWNLQMLGNQLLPNYSIDYVLVISQHWASLLKKPVEEAKLAKG